VTGTDRADSGRAPVVVASGALIQGVVVMSLQKNNLAVACVSAVWLSSTVASAGWTDASTFGVGALAVWQGIACGIGYEQQQVYNDPYCCYNDATDPSTQYCYLQPGDERVGCDANDACCFFDPNDPQNPNTMFCELQPGDERPSNCEARWGDYLACFQPAADGEITGRNAPPSKLNSPFRGTIDVLRIKSIAIAWDPDSPLLEGDGQSWDKRVIYALRGDGVVYASYGAVEEPDRDYAFGAWQPYADPVSALGEELEFRHISAVQAAGFEPLLYGVTTDNELYYTAGDVWTAASAEGDTQFFAFVGGPFGALGLIGDSSLDKDLGVYFRTTGGPGPIIPQTIPPVPSTESLALSSTGFQYYPPLWDVNLLYLPIALGLSDAWLIFNSSDTTNFLLRSRAGATAFSEWEAYPTTPWVGFTDAGDIPYSLADASVFRSGYAGMQGKRGELFALGNGVHILHYYPDDDLDAESLELGTAAWSAVDEANASMLVVDPTTSTSGETSLRFDAAGYIEIESEPFLASNLDASGGQVYLDVLAQPGSGWLGAVQLYIEVPDAQLYHQYAGQADIAPVAAGEWRRITFDVPQYLQDAVRSQPTAVRVGLAVNSPTPGVRLDNLVFGGPAPEPPLSDYVCSGACLSATALQANTYSGSLGTTQAVWFVVEDAVNGWQASELGSRTVRVNGEVVAPGGALPLRAADGRYYFEFSAGTPTWTSWNFW
jgi:hypothetical protein